MTKLPFEVEDDARQELDRWREWSDEGREGHWPYPDRHVRSIANGELEERLIRALGVSEDSNVFITESIHYSGSEYTQDNFRWIIVSSGNVEKRFEETNRDSAFALLLAWLDREAPKSTGLHCATCTCDH